MLKREWALIALVYFALAEVLSLAPVSDLSLCLVQPEHGEQATNHDNKKYCPAFHTGVIAALDTVDGILERHDKSVIGGFTIILAISTIGLWLATNKLWAAGERQFGLLAQTAAAQSHDMQDSIKAAQEANRIARESMIADHRAWLQIDDVCLPYPTGFYDDRIDYQIQYKITNIGRTLARSVWIDIETYYSTNNSEHFMDARTRILTKAMLTPPQLGTVIFPDDTDRHRLRFVDSPEKFGTAIRVYPTGERKIDVVVFITATYRIEGDDTPHVTHRSYGALNVPMPTVLQEGATLALPETPFLQGVIT